MSESLSWKLEIVQSRGKKIFLWHYKTLREKYIKVQ